MKHHVSYWVLLILALLMVSSLTGCFPFPMRNLFQPPQRAPEALSTQAPQVVTRVVEVTSTPVVATPPPPIASTTGESLLETLYERANPSVVHIFVAIKVHGQTFSFGPNLPGFPRFFGPQESQDYYQQGEGSGFVYDLEGHIITNNHVVGEAEEIRVTFSDDFSVPAKVVGTDPDSDLAVIKVDVDPARLHPLPVGNSDALRVGQRVVAIGNPFGLQGTMTTGIISALGRLMPAGEAASDGGHYTIPDIIQTDAAINPGNSGGPLIDMHGQVVGVNAAIESPVKGFAGIGFAIPVNIVRKVAPAIIAQGHYEHPWLGVSTVSLNPALNKVLGLPEEQRGVMIVTVIENSPADKAHLHPCTETVKVEEEEIPSGGDIITAIDGQPVKKFDDLISYLSLKSEVGQKVRLTVLRDGNSLDVLVTLGARQPQSP